MSSAGSAEQISDVSCIVLAVKLLLGMAAKPGAGTGLSSVTVNSACPVRTTPSGWMASRTTTPQGPGLERIGRATYTPVISLERFFHERRVPPAHHMVERRR